MRVGADTGQLGGGTVGPIYPDGTWSYIPIPDINSIFPFAYNKIPATQNKRTMLSDWMPKKYNGQCPHYDPEFWNYSYGEPGINDCKAIKCRQILTLEKGDLLYFWAGLTSRHEKNPGIYNVKAHRTIECYLIGYLRIKQIFIVDIHKKNLINFLFKNQLNLNAHTFKEKKASKDFIVVKGEPKTSILLKYPLKLTNNNQRSKNTQKSKKNVPISILNDLGLKKISFRSGAGNWISEKVMTYFNSVLKDEPYPEWISKHDLEKKIMNNARQKLF